MREELMKISEFAKIANTTRKTLQYYDDIGLFSPTVVAENGYRYYSLLQLDRLALITVLRDMGLPLKEIMGYLERGEAEELGRLLEQQSKEIDRSIELLRRRKAMLADALAENDAFQTYGGKGFQILSWEDERISRLTAINRRPPFVVNYLTDGLHTGLCLQGPKHFFYQKRPDGDICAEGGEYLCIYDFSTFCVQRWLADTMDGMIRYAADNGILLNDCFYAEFNDITLVWKEGQQLFPRMLRVKIRNDQRHC